MPKIVILMRDTLAAVGLQTLLQQRLQLDSVIVDGDLDLSAHSADFASVTVITDPDCYADNAWFFALRRPQTIICKSGPASRPDAEPPVVCTKNTIEEIAGQLARYLHRTQKEPDAGKQLSPREIDVLRLVAQGKINKEIAIQLNISINTVLTHRKNITSKLGIKSVSGLSFYAMMNGLINPPK